jgi:predicted ArsR family transcriptional regulator
MKGGCWDARQAVEEIAILLRAWRAGELSPEEAIEEVQEVLYRNNFGPLLEERDERD